PIAKFMQGLIHKYVEKTADNAVVRKMNEPLSLAGAIVKIAKFHKENMMLQPVSINGYGSPEARIRRLVEGKDETVQLPGRKTIAASIVMAGFLAASLAMPLFASFPDAKQCDTSHCDMHKDKLGKDCQKHCKNMKQHEHSAHTTF
ncbi:MAG: hypothetical protein HY265_05910, partial [Deltaproteobacteria bacterium]|nr:hypothetical protein [Deltaproteobacteria bacterium]